MTFLSLSLSSHSRSFPKHSVTFLDLRPPPAPPTDPPSSPIPPEPPHPPDHQICFFFGKSYAQPPLSTFSFLVHAPIPFPTLDLLTLYAALSLALMALFYESLGGLLFRFGSPFTADCSFSPIVSTDPMDCIAASSFPLLELVSPDRKPSPVSSEACLPPFIAMPTTTSTTSSGFVTALVRIYTAECSLCSTYVHVSFLMEWPLQFISSSCDLSIGLVGVEEYYDSIGSVITLPCIEVRFRQVLVTHFAKGVVPFISYGAYYLVVARFTILCQSFLACRFVGSALVAISVAIRKFIFSPKIPLAVSGFVAQDSSVLQGSSSRHCLSSAFGADFLALVAGEGLVLLLASRGMRNGVQEAFEISYDIRSLFGYVLSSFGYVLPGPVQTN